MTRSDDRPTVHVQADGRVLAAAEIEPPDETGVVHSTLHVESGQLPPGTRSSLVDAVLEHPEVDRARRLVATMPLGDTEMLDRVRQRTRQVQARAAGATKIVEARLDAED
jgi:hypothetical protein